MIFFLNTSIIFFTGCSLPPIEKDLTLKFIEFLHKGACAKYAEVENMKKKSQKAG